MDLSTARTGNGTRPDGSTDEPVAAVTLLYVPGDRPDRVGKAFDTEADVVVVDLEDAVAPTSKRDARGTVERLLHRLYPEQQVQVRVNPLATPWGRDDLAMVDALPPAVDLRVPKVESPEAIDEVVGRLTGGRRLHCIVESASGVERAGDIARAHPSVASLAVGEADLRAELGQGASRVLTWCRMRVVLAARAAGLPAPLQPVWTAVRDLDGLAASCAEGRREGFVGGAAIHPAQLPIIRAAYRPRAEEVAWARDVVRRLGSAHLEGTGVLVTDNGDFLDEAMVRGARQVLELAELTGAA